MRCATGAGRIREERPIRVDGVVEGRIQDEGRIHVTGRVQGDLIAPQVILEKACRCRGTLATESPVKVGQIRR